MRATRIDLFGERILIEQVGLSNFDIPEHLVSVVAVDRSEVVAGFSRVFGRLPQFVSRAPGRVNLIGEHTDYNDGWVMPVAIEFATWTGIAPRKDAGLRVYAADKQEEALLNPDDPRPSRPGHWSSYVIGIAAELAREAVRIGGADLWISGDVPEGAGLSSSAALEMSVGTALLAVADQKIEPARLAMAGQRAEHHFAGTRCGIMDQFISVHGREDHALMLDCRSLEYRHVPIPAGIRLVICDTGVKHSLASSEYNRRRSECEQGVAVLSPVLPGIRALRDVSSADLEKHRDLLPSSVLRRCRHVVRENARVQEFAAALAAADLSALGQLMADSHASLRDDYQVSCPELDAMVEVAVRSPGIIGARMTGGGFGGCTVNLVAAPAVGEFTESVKAGYAKVTGRTPRILVSRGAAGASIVPP